MSDHWCLIPPTVLFDSDLTSTQKILYGKILGLTSKTGYCWATNEFFAQMFDISERSIQRHIKALESAGHVEVEYGDQRKIKARLSGVTKLSPGGDKTVAHTDSIEIDNTKLAFNLLARDIWQYWGDRRADVLISRGLMERRRIPSLSDKRKKAIRKARDAGYREDDMILAIDGVLGSDYHVTNGFTDLTLCLNTDKIDQYIVKGLTAQKQESQKETELEEFFI